MLKRVIPSVSHDKLQLKPTCRKKNRQVFLHRVIKLVTSYKVTLFNIQQDALKAMIKRNTLFPQRALTDLWVFIQPL